LDIDIPKTFTLFSQMKYPTFARQVPKGHEIKRRGAGAAMI